MTRFARAKGSKSSNLRLPEDATPWREMKPKTPSKRRIEEAEIQSTNEVVTKKRKIVSVEPKNTEWADFSDSNYLKLIKFGKNKNITMESSKAETKKKKQKDKYPLKQTINKSEVQESFPQVENLKKSKESKKRLKEISEGNDVRRKGIPESIIEEQVAKKKKKKLKKQNTDSKESSFVVEEQVSKKEKKKLKKQNIDSKDNSLVPEEQVVKKKKKKLKKQNTDSKDGSFVRENLKSKNKSDGQHQQSFENQNRQSDKKAQRKQNWLEKRNNQKNFQGRGQKNFENRNIVGQKAQKTKKLRTGEPKRRKPIPSKEVIYVGGKAIEIAYFSGFPVKKEDAERLTQLKKQMISKGIPHSEVQNALKLERRKAEKALTREKKKLCFHCRQSGHNLSECPSLTNENAGTGICFKCGSTEHTYFECKVVRGDNFKFAQCFICREQGHISKQCPDNPKGLYPKGGACKICGDVTHLKKDCPQLQSEREGTQGTLQTINDKQIESLEEEIGTTNKHREKPKQNKIIKF